MFFSFTHLWHLLFLFCYFNLPLKFYAGYFYVSLNLTGILQFPNLAESVRDAAPLSHHIRHYWVFKSHLLRGSSGILIKEYPIAKAD